MQWWYLYVVGGCAIGLVVFAHIDERVRNRKHRAKIEKTDVLRRQLTSAASQQNDFTAVGS
jgi:hypothetical protein